MHATLQIRRTFVPELFSQPGCRQLCQTSNQPTCSGFPKGTEGGRVSDQSLGFLNAHRALRGRVPASHPDPHPALAAHRRSASAEVKTHAKSGAPSNWSRRPAAFFRTRRRPPDFRARGGASAQACVSIGPQVECNSTCDSTSKCIVIIKKGGCDPTCDSKCECVSMGRKGGCDPTMRFEVDARATRRARHSARARHARGRGGAGVREVERRGSGSGG